MEHLKTIDLFGDAGVLDRCSRNVTHRQRCAAARVAVEFGEDHPGERERIAEAARRIDGVLSLHGIDDEQGLDRIHRSMHLADFPHHRLVDGEAARRIDDENVVVVLSRPIERGQCDRHRLFAERRREDIHADLPGEQRKLFDGRGAVDVGRNHEHLLLLSLQEVRELRRRGGLARTLQSGHEQDGRRLHCEIERHGCAAHQRGQLAVHDADERLSRRQGPDDFLADRLVLDLRDEVLDHRQRNVGLEQRKPNLAQRVLNIRVREARLAAQRLDDLR